MMQGKMFKNTQEFAIYIDEVVATRKLTHMEAVLEYCKDYFIDPEDISSMINKTLKQKIAVNMRDENYLPKVAKLDI